MCCRFFVPGRDDPEYGEFIGTVKKPELIKLSSEISPKDTVAVLANNRSNVPSAFPMRWGYTEYGKLIFNTRSETAAEKQIFRDGMLNRRCLIPASCYFEWDKDKNKYRIGTGSIIWLAGIYRFEDNFPVFSVLTQEPTEELSVIHNRMPVIIPRESKAAWLHKSTDPNTLIHSSVKQLEYSVIKK